MQDGLYMLRKLCIGAWSDGSRPALPAPPPGPAGETRAFALSGAPNLAGIWHGMHLLLVHKLLGRPGHCNSRNRRISARHAPSLSLVSPRARARYRWLKSARDMPAACTVTPLLVSGRCELGTHYGCYAGERKMWTILPCHGSFKCDDFELQCKSSRVTEKPGHVHNCTCFEYEARQTPHGPMVQGNVPESIRQSRLRENAINEARFVPQTDAEIIHATFTFWNVLDRVMLVSSKSNWQTGYVREMQVRRMQQLVTQPGVRTYCEGA